MLISSTMIKPAKLQPGDTVALLSPSWGGPSLFPDVYENGVRYLVKVLGLQVREYPTTRMEAGQLYRSPELRARDLNAAFADPEVRGIFASIGGDDCIRLLPHLDLPVILKNPKIFMGYSDTTALLGYLNLHGLVTYYGNSVMAGFSYLENFPDAGQEYREVLFQGYPREIRPFACWTDKYEPWGDKANVGKVSRLHEDDVGHRWVQKGQKSAGPLWGGCLEVLTMMNGTAAWPQADFWNGRTLMLETSEDKPLPFQVGFFLRNLGMQGVFSRLAGLLVAKPKDYSPEEKKELDEVVVKIVTGEFGAGHLNIVTNLEFGHTDPRHIMPLGTVLEMDPEKETLRFLESLVK